jgi:hypothetical protein
MALRSTFLLQRLRDEACRVVCERGVRVRSGVIFLEYRTKVRAAGDGSSG